MGTPVDIRNIQRSATIIMLATSMLPFFTGCAGDDKSNKDKKEEAKQTTTIVKRVSPVCSLQLPCGDDEKLWTGPDNSTVNVVLSGGINCPASLLFLDKKTGKESPSNVQAAAGKQNSTSVKVPAGQVLKCSCGEEEAQGNCSCTITGVAPPLPPNVTMGQAQAVTPPPPVQNPPTAPAMGTPVTLSCGKQAPLWSGPASYVTVTFQGSAQCRAKVTPKREGSATAGGEEITDERPWSRTFGPVTSLDANCDGKDANGSCRFQVTETIELPKP